MSRLAPHLNPFRVSRLEALRYRPPDAGSNPGSELDRAWTDRLLDRWTELGRRGALVGPHGSGKTTLLEELESLLEGRGHRVHRLRFDTEHRVLDSQRRAALDDVLGAPDLDGLAVSIDGVEQLGVLAWARLRVLLQRRLLSHGGGLLLTSHRRDPLPSRLHTPTLHRHETSVELLRDLVGELAGEPDERLEQLFADHRGDVRACLRALYDRAAAELI